MLTFRGFALLFQRQKYIFNSLYKQWGLFIAYEQSWDVDRMCRNYPQIQSLFNKKLTEEIKSKYPSESSHVWDHQ